MVIGVLSVKIPKVRPEKNYGVSMKGCNQRQLLGTYGTDHHDAYRSTFLNLEYYLKTIQDGHLKVQKQHQEAGRPRVQFKFITNLANIFKSSHEHEQKYPYMLHRTLQQNEKMANQQTCWILLLLWGNPENYIDMLGSFQWIQNREFIIDSCLLPRTKVWWQMAVYCKHQAFDIMMPDFTSGQTLRSGSILRKHASATEDTTIFYDKQGDSSRKICWESRNQC